ncbi:uncharacterized protein [Blastocystis hominis]|uniref:Uncharacterized protein n=1 Tax=Blastocystis hominis TaxID=12968 RepID=D8M592_BLAHO|nr:uncharacterized protein [Blastocystis hominis]CBK23231.2 unnamed protein product [Blastocystis hominis]|eukprot:XP_012897279.1 uncharacterized protein [Blastocystis hominis]
MNPNAGKKSNWPEVVGLPFVEAEKVIMGDRPDCKVIHVKPGVRMTRDYNPFRVFVITEKEEPYKVVSPPGCG